MSDSVRDLAYLLAAKDAAWELLPAVVFNAATGEIAMTSPPIDSEFNYLAGELIGQCADILVPEHLREAHKRFREEYASQGGIRHLAGGLFVGRRKDGTTFPVRIGLNMATLLGHSYVIAVIIDISAC